MQTTPRTTLSVEQLCDASFGLTEIAECHDPMQPVVSDNVGVVQMADDRTREFSVCSELDLFLLGLGLKELIPRFNSRRVTFQAFLQMTESDLCQLGISSGDVRKHILDAIDDTHRKRLRYCLSKPLQYNKKINCSESNAILTNIKRHLGFMGSSIGYVSDRMNEDKLIVLDSSNPVHIYELCAHTENALVNVRNLYEELVGFRMQLQELYHNKEFFPEELIISQTPRLNFNRVVLLCGGVLGCIGTVYLLFRI